MAKILVNLQTAWKGLFSLLQSLSQSLKGQGPKIQQTDNAFEYIQMTLHKKPSFGENGFFYSVSHKQQFILFQH